MTSIPKYLKLTLKIEPLLPGREIALAWLDTCGFDMFENKADGLIAHGKESDINRDACNEILLDLAGIAKVSSDLEVVESENWNATWEADYPAIDVDGLACMRAPFHSKPQSGLDVVIQPQMSFGTGHHATTWQMLRRLLDESVSGKSILDMGCGTGVLAIASHLLGAAEVVAIDIDSWSFENTRANYELNGLDAVSAPGQVLLGDSRLLAPWLERFDLLLANINRNVLLEDMPRFDRVLKASGRVLMSGFFHSDLDQLKEQASKMKWNFISSTEREGWCCGLWEKSSL